MSLSASEKAESAPATRSLSLGKKLEENPRFLNLPHNLDEQVGNAAAELPASTWKSPAEEEGGTSIPAVVPINTESGFR